MPLSSQSKTVLVVSVLVLVSLVLIPTTGPSSSAATVPSTSTPTSAPASSASPSLSASAAGVVEVAPAFTGSSGDSAVGPVPSGTPLTVEVGLALPDPSSLAGLVSELYSPGTSEYRHFRTTAELAADFGPSESNVTRALAYFEGFGLSASVSADRLLLTISGPSDRMAAAFGTSFELYRGADGRSFLGHPTDATLPAIAPWSGVFGLGNQTEFAPVTLASPVVETRITPSVSCTGTPTVLVPCQIWQAYNMTPLISSGTNGSGFRVAVVDPYTADEGQAALTRDLAEFASASSIGVGTVNYLYPVPSSSDLNATTYPGWSGELALDLEWARAAAPGATIDMTFAPNPGVGLYEAVDWLVAHQAADVISMSWGEPDVGIFNAYLGPCSFACNASTDGSYGILAPVLQFAAAEGISVFAASGDCGASDGTSGVSTNFPASDPYVTGVGGTNLTVQDDGDWSAEVGWGGNPSGAVAPGCQNQGGSGGGYSPFPRPTWQTALLHAESGRGVPDVALDAGVPVTVVLGGQLVAVAGTSVGTPIWAGIAALADQYAGRALGFLNPSLYAIASGGNYSVDFHDIVSGYNGYSAGTGWDPVTGLGSPLVSFLVKDLAHARSLSTSDLSAFVFVSPRFGFAPLTVTVRVNVTGGTGVYPLEGVSFGDGNASYATDQAAHYTFEAPGVYLVQAYVADSQANYSVSPPVAVVVGGGGPLTVNLTASTDRPAVDANVSFVTAVAGGVPPYTFQYTFGDGTFLASPSVASTNHTFGARGSYCAEVVVSDSASPVNGGASSRVAIGVGGAPLPDCGNDSIPLVIHTRPTPAVRDAPADFPGLTSAFTVTGGSGALAPTLQIAATDPYIAACGCSIFRTAGTYVVTAYANDSENQQTVARTNVTVAPPLRATFTLNQTVGSAPLPVDFRVSATGGYEANASRTDWKFGDGAEASGANVLHTYLVPGTYLAVADLSDPGQGNASEAFLIDVRPPASVPSPSIPYLNVSISPAVDVPLGTTVNFSAALSSPTGGALPSAFVWSVGAASGAYRSSFRWTYSSNSTLEPNGSLPVALRATDTATGGTANVTLVLPNFAAVEPNGFALRADALTLADQGGPSLGVAPLTWSGAAHVTGPGTLAVAWDFPLGAPASGSSVERSLSAGTQTVEVNATDSWGDVATDVLPVDVAEPIVVTASVSPAGSSSLLVRYTASATGGFGPPYRFSWSFGDGTGATVANGSHAYGAGGAYRVTLNVTDPKGFSNTTILSVDLSPHTAPPATAFPLWVVLVGAATIGVVAAVIATVPSRRRTP